MKLSFSILYFPFLLLFFFFLFYFFITVIPSRCIQKTVATFFFHLDSKMRYANMCIYVCVNVCNTRFSIFEEVGGSFFVEGIFQLEASMRFIASRKTRCKKGDHWWKGLLFESLKRGRSWCMLDMDLDFGFFSTGKYTRLYIYLFLKRLFVWKFCFSRRFEFLKSLEYSWVALFFFLSLQYYNLFSGFQENSKIRFHFLTSFLKIWPRSSSQLELTNWINDTWNVNICSIRWRGYVGVWSIW